MMQVPAELVEPLYNMCTLEPLWHATKLGAPFLFNQPFFNDIPHVLTHRRGTLYLCSIRKGMPEVMWFQKSYLGAMVRRHVMQLSSPAQAQMHKQKHLPTSFFMAHTQASLKKQ